MTWPQVAAEHIGHRCRLTDTRSLRCVDCDRTLILPRPSGPETPTPPPYRPPTVEGRPMPHGWRDRVMAEIDARKAARTPREDTA